MKVILSGIFYPMAILRYYEAALKRRADVELFTVGPYTGMNIPWNGGMDLPPKYAKAPDLSMHQGTGGKVDIRFIENQVPFEPDLWIQIDAGFHFIGKPRSGKNVIVGTDPHCLNYDYQRTVADTFYCMQTPYIKPEDEYLPYAYDPIWHAPEEQPRKYDVVLCGLHYDNRNKLVSSLQQLGVNVYYDLGPVFDEVRALYNQAPIGLNWSSLQDLTARVFELTAMRRLAVVNRVPDLAAFFEEDKDLIVFDSLSDAVDKIVYYLAHPDEAEAIAAQGYETVRPHSWDARIETILGAL